MLITTLDGAEKKVIIYKTTLSTQATSQPSEYPHCRWYYYKILVLHQNKSAHLKKILWCHTEYWLKFGVILAKCSVFYPNSNFVHLNVRKEFFLQEKSSTFCMIFLCQIIPRDRATKKLAQHAIFIFERLYFPSCSILFALILLEVELST